MTTAVRSDRLYPSHEAIDFYHHYEEDIALFAEMGFKTCLLYTSPMAPSSWTVWIC